MPIYGVNLPWLHGSYGHDLAVNERNPDWGYAFDRERAVLPFRESSWMGFDAVRLWLCENGEGVITEGGRVRGVHPALLEHVGEIASMAGAEGLSLYCSFLDANSCQREGDRLTRSILGDGDQAARFAEYVVAPIVKRLPQEVLFAIELVNEPEAVTPNCLEATEDPLPWEVVGRSLATLGDAVRAERDVPVTSGTMHYYVEQLWQSGARLDAVDLHLYFAQGGLPPLWELAQYAGDPRIASGEVPVFAGECGMPEEGEPDPEGLLNYLCNASVDGYAAVFLWRLEHWLVEQTEAREVTSTGKAVRRALAEAGSRGRGRGAHRA